MRSCASRIAATAPRRQTGPRIERGRRQSRPGRLADTAWALASASWDSVPFCRRINIAVNGDIGHQFDCAIGRRDRRRDPQLSQIEEPGHDQQFDERHAVLDRAEQAEHISSLEDAPEQGERDQIPAGFKRANAPMSIGTARLRPSISRAAAQYVLHPPPAAGLRGPGRRSKQPRRMSKFTNSENIERVHDIMFADAALHRLEQPVSDPDLDLGRRDVMINDEILAAGEDLCGDIVPHENVL